MSWNALHYFGRTSERRVKNDGEKQHLWKQHFKKFRWENIILTCDWSCNWTWASWKLKRRLPKNSREKLPRFPNAWTVVGCGFRKSTLRNSGSRTEKKVPKQARPSFGKNAAREKSRRNLRNHGLGPAPNTTEEPGSRILYQARQIMSSFSTGLLCCETALRADWRHLRWRPYSFKKSGVYPSSFDESYRPKFSKTSHRPKWFIHSAIDTRASR